MAKRYVYQKSAAGVSDFVYVDLLPEVKRARQFNMNVIIVGTLAVIATWVFVFIPYRTQTEIFEEKNGVLNDLTHRLTLKLEEQELHEIDLGIIQFEEEIDALLNLQVDFRVMKNQVDNVIESTDNEAYVRDISYSAIDNTLLVKVATKYDFYDTTFLDDFEDLDWTGTVTLDSNSTSEDLYVFTYTLEVNPEDVE